MILQRQGDVGEDEGDEESHVTDVADDLLQVKTWFRFVVVAGRIFFRSFYSAVLAETGFNLDIRDLGDEQRGVTMWEKVRRERHLSRVQPKRTFRKTDPTQGHSKQVQAADVHLTLDTVAGIFGGNPWEALHKQEVKTQPNWG